MTADPITSIRNLGPRTAEEFARAGIHTADELRSIGADEAYSRLLASGTRPHFIGYYVLVLGLQGRPWNDLGPDEKASLRGRFDAIVAKSRKNAAGIEVELDRIGVRARSTLT